MEQPTQDDLEMMAEELHSRHMEMDGIPDDKAHGGKVAGAYLVFSSQSTAPEYKVVLGQHPVASIAVQIKMCFDSNLEPVGMVGWTSEKNKATKTFEVRFLHQYLNDEPWAKATVDKAKEASLACFSPMN